MKITDKDLIGNAVTFINAEGEHIECFVAFCDKSKGITIKDLDTASIDMICINIKQWDKQRKLAKERGEQMLYKYNGKDMNDFVRLCALHGICDLIAMKDETANEHVSVSVGRANCASGA
jgi:hypothetical protein